MTCEAPRVICALLPIIMLIVGIPVALLLVVLPFWKICSKAGFHGALSLLMLVPVANIVLPFFLAFSDWPALKEPEAASTET